MSLSNNAQAIYNHLVNVVIPAGRVITYSGLGHATGVPLGPPGQSPVVEALYDIFKACDEHKLPPITSIVVQQGGEYDPTGIHGMPGGGYLVAEAHSQNRAGRRRDPGFEDWGNVPRPADTETWQMREMIEAHQDSVWDHDGPWPPIL